jgi:hypothetical protein
MLGRLWYLILFCLGLIRNHTKKPEHDIASLPEKKALKVCPTIEEEEAEAAKDAEAAKETKEPDPPKLNLPLKPQLPGPAKPQPPAPKEKTQWDQRWEVIQEMLDRPYDSPMDDLPSRRYPRTRKLANGETKVDHGVYSVYGRPSKQKKNSRIKGYPVCKQKVHEKLPGSWNKGRPRLYMQVDVGQHMREALNRAEELQERISEIMDEEYKVLDYIFHMGSYSYRHIQHNPSKDLSYHSWTIAADQNPGWNRGVKYHPTKWLRRVKKNGKTTWVETSPARADKGPIHKVLPFSKQYWEIFPKSMPPELVFAFKSVHWAWGGDWGRWKWQLVLQAFGDKFDQEAPEIKNSKLFQAAMEEWKSMRYYDGMHLECTTRGEFARNLWAQHEAALEDNIHLV